MNKEDWQNLYKELRELYFEYRRANSDYSKGSNQKKRDVGEREVNHLLNKADRLLTRNDEVYDLFTGPDSTDVGRSYSYDDSMQPWRFEDSLSSFLDRIEEKIKNFE